MIHICFLATKFGADVQGGSFYATETYGYARATVIMNSKSHNDFRWRVEVTGGLWISIGISSELRQVNEWIEDYDEKAILCMLYPEEDSFEGYIYLGETEIHEHIVISKSDEIQFLFQPKLKKFTILLVRLLILNWLRFWI